MFINVYIYECDLLHAADESFYFFFRFYIFSALLAPIFSRSLGLFLIVNSLPFVLLCISCESISVGFSRFYRFHSFSSLAFWSLQTMYFTNKKMLTLIYFILLYSVYNIYNNHIPSINALRLLKFFQNLKNAIDAVVFPSGKNGKNVVFAKKVNLMFIE